MKESVGMETPSNALKLIADDGDGLAIVSAAVQDAITKPELMTFNRKARSFGLVCNRFCWERANRSGPYFRSRAVLSFFGVESVQQRGVSPGAHVILGLDFEAAEIPPGGVIRIILAGTATIRLTVECIDVALVDQDASWPTPRRPRHGADE